MDYCPFMQVTGKIHITPWGRYCCKIRCAKRDNGWYSLPLEFPAMPACITIVYDRQESQILSEFPAQPVRQTAVSCRGTLQSLAFCPCRTEQPIESPTRHRPLQASVLSHWQCYSSTDCLEHLSTSSFWNRMTDNLPLAQIHRDFCCRLNGSEWGSATKKPPRRRLLHKPVSGLPRHAGDAQVLHR
jgi:hypothetical protein